MWKRDPVKLKVSVLNVIVTCCRWFLSSVLVCVWLPGTAIQRRSPVGRYFTLKSSFLFPDLSLIYTFCCFDVLCPVFLPISVVPSSLCAQCMRVFLLLHNGFIICLLLLQDVDTIYLTQDTRELNLQDFVHLENRYVSRSCPLFLWIDATKTNTLSHKWDEFVFFFVFVSVRFLCLFPLQGSGGDHRSSRAQPVVQQTLH